MNYFASHTAIVVALLLSSTSAFAQDAAATADELGDEIRTGTAGTRGTSVDFGTAIGVVDAPVEEVLEAVTDYANYHEFMPNFRTSRVLSQRGRNAMVYMEVAVMRNSVTLWAQLRIFARRPDGDAQVIEARMTQGNMDHFVARWTVRPIADGRSLVEFRILVDPDLPVPASLATRENIKAARRSVSALRGRVAS